MRLPQVSFHDQDFFPTLQYGNRVLVIPADIPRFLGIVSVLLRDPVTPLPPLYCLGEERSKTGWNHNVCKGTERESVVANTVLRGLKKINCHLTASEEYQQSLMGGSGKFNPHPIRR